MYRQKILKKFSDLYDGVRGELDDIIDEEAFSKKVEALVEDGYICTGAVDDFTIYFARESLKWEDFVNMEDAIKKSILLLLVENPRTFFVLQNTQKGKMRIASLELRKWGLDRTKKVVAFIIVDNDKTLADQSVDGLLRTFEEQKSKIFALSSSSKTSFEEIKTYIDAYANDIVEEGKEPEYPIPIIALLANGPQCAKMLKLLNHIHRKVTINNSQLRYGIIWDEADKTYAQLRDKAANKETPDLTCKTFLVEKTQGLYRLGFVTATDGNLLEEDYPECANAYLYPVDISPEDQEHYRALHHHEAKTQRVAFTSKHTNNSYAMQILSDKLDHFKTPMQLPSGDTYYRKVIVNSNAKTDDMKAFAEWCVDHGMYALVFNGYGGASVKVYGKGLKGQPHRTKGKRLNELLFYIYKILNLHDKPIVIIGRRKVDRGLGFHYCPRSNNEIQINGTLGILTTKNREGLVWTDMILGRIEDKDSAVQKAGRLAGIIGNSPQYPGTTHYWTDEHTEQLIRRHNTIVDKSNDNFGCSVLQAVKKAESSIPMPKVNHRVNLDMFLVYKDEETVRKVCEILEYQYRSVKEETEGQNAGFRETSLNTVTTKVSLLDAILKVPSSYGTQPKDKDNEDVTKRKHKYIKINDGTKVDNNNIGGKFGMLNDKHNDKEYNVLVDNVTYRLTRECFSLITYRTCYPCYKNINDKDSLHFVIIIRPGTDINKLRYVKDNHPSIEIPQEGEY